MAQLFNIKSLKKMAIASVVSPSDFKMSLQGEVDFREYIAQHLGRVTPYCIDQPRREVLFVGTSDDVDLITCKPFIYEGQRLTAEKVIRASFDELHQLVQMGGYDEVIKPLFLYSTGRCGSTLLCNLMGDCSDLVAVSEPDYFTQLPFLLQKHGAEVGEELAQVTHDLSVLLLAHIRVRYPQGDVVFKLRSQCNEVAELIQCAFPDARNIFLYRNVVATVNSFCSVLAGHPLIRFAKLLNSKYFPLLNIIPVGALNLVPLLSANIRAVAPLSSQFKYAKVGIGTGTGVFALAWLSGLDKVLQIQRNNGPFFGAVLRYEELKNQPFETIATLLRQLGLPPVNEDSRKQMTFTLQKDSQQGSDLASSGEYVLSALDEQLIARAIESHKVVNSLDYQLPGSIITASEITVPEITAPEIKPNDALSNELSMRQI